MRKEFLILGLAVFSLETGIAEAACTLAPNCTEMGYTKTASECKNGSVKCPWNTSMVYCSPSCSIGNIYYADGTCLTPENHNTSKVALGVVVYVTDGGKHGQVMSAWPVDKNGKKSSSNVGMTWSTEKVDIPDLPNYTTHASAATDFNSCSNTTKIVMSFDVSIYSAAEAAREYAPTTETKGKWCLPAAGVMASIYNNQSAVQAGISKLGGVTYPSCCTWSSSETSSSSAWYSYLGDSSGLGSCTKSSNLYVRPVLEF